jgi:translation initiation factor 1A
MPQKGELLGRVVKLVGGDNIIVKCTDGVSVERLSEECG